jgi:hypothetical protein
VFGIMRDTVRRTPSGKINVRRSSRTKNGGRNGSQRPPNNPWSEEHYAKHKKTTVNDTCPLTVAENHRAKIVVVIAGPLVMRTVR